MVSINNVTVAFGSYTLLDAVSFHISDGEKIGLVGKNGAGKSTMMKIILGVEKPDSGRVEMPREQTVGYLHKELVAATLHTQIQHGGHVVHLGQLVEPVPFPCRQWLYLLFRAKSPCPQQPVKVSFNDVHEYLRG